MATELVIVHSGSGLHKGVGHPPLVRMEPGATRFEESIVGSTRCFDGIVLVAKLGTGGLVKVSMGVPSKLGFGPGSGSVQGAPGAWVGCLCPLFPRL